MLKSMIAGMLASAALLNAAHAITVADLTGTEVKVSVITTQVGGRDFNAELFGADTANIGAGAEFQLRLTSGDFGGGNNENFLDLDIDASGEVSLTTMTSFFYGAFYYNAPAAFTIEIDFTDPTLSAIDATPTGDLGQGNASVSSLDPINWNFVTDVGGFANSQIEFGFNAGSLAPPGLSLAVDSSPVPLPAAFPLLGIGLVLLRWTGRKTRLG